MRVPVEFVLSLTAIDAVSNTLLQIMFPTELVTIIEVTVVSIPVIVLLQNMLAPSVPSLLCPTFIPLSPDGTLVM